MIEIVGGASNFTHVTRLLPASLSQDRRHLHVLEEFLVQNRLSVASMLLHRSELCVSQVLQLTTLFTYPAHLTTLLGQRCLDNRWAYCTVYSIDTQKSKFINLQLSLGRFSLTSMRCTCMCYLHNVMYMHVHVLLDST